MLHIPTLYIAESEKKGRGVFTSDVINEGDLIEICPLVLFPQKDCEFIDKTSLFHYYFFWPGEEGGACIALGYGSLYNHGTPPNAKIFVNLEDKEFEYRCIRQINGGEEILIDYMEGDDTKQLWFEEF